jgi:hypothetical protein
MRMATAVTTVPPRITSSSTCVLRSSSTMGRTRGSPAAQDSAIHTCCTGPSSSLPPMATSDSASQGEGSHPRDPHPLARELDTDLDLVPQLGLVRQLLLRGSLGRSLGLHRHLPGFPEYQELGLLHTLQAGCVSLDQRGSREDRRRVRRVSRVVGLVSVQSISPTSPVPQVLPVSGVPVPLAVLVHETTVVSHVPYNLDRSCHFRILSGTSVRRARPRGLSYLYLTP